jgi:hypothetical protein
MTRLEDKSGQRRELREMALFPAGCMKVQGRILVMATDAIAREVENND